MSAFVPSAAPGLPPLTWVRPSQLTCLRTRPRARTPQRHPAAAVASLTGAGAAGGDNGGGVVGNRVCIEYCTGCRWGLRASWMATELLVTFGDGALGEVAVRPSVVPGTFRVWVVRAEDGTERRVWCRKEQARFPELKELKQLVREVIAPEMSLGHSDRAAPSV
jgi:selenoprotein W-related protein